MRAVAMLSFHNEADMLAEVIDGLLEQGLEVVALDNGSTDGAYDVCRPYRDRGEIALDRWDPDRIDLDQLTRRLYRSALGLKPDWMLWCDGDELLQAAQPDRSLREVIAAADAAGDNLIPFDRFDFFMTDADDPDETRVTRSLRHYSWQGDFSYRAWRYVPGIRAFPSLAHLPIFPPGVRYRIHPEKQVLRNYPYRTPPQARAKLDTFLSKFSRSEREGKGWQSRYVRLAEQGLAPARVDASLLARLEERGEWMREPVFTPFTHTQPSRSDLFTGDGRLKRTFPDLPPLEREAPTDG